MLWSIPLALFLAWSGAVSAQARPVLHQRLVGQLGPMGAEHALAIGVRTELGDPDELLFTGAHAEAGIVNYTSPIYTMTGGYLEVSPLAFLVLRAVLTTSEVWPIGQDGAGYYGAQVEGPLRLDAAAGEHARGWSATISAVLQGAVPIGPLRAILWSEASFEHVRLGTEPFHFSARHDAWLARDEWIVGNWAMALIEIPLGSRWSLRAGLYDDVRHVPRSGAVSNQLGGVAMLHADGPIPEIGDLLAFVRAGGVTHHERREGELSLLAGVLVRYELAPPAR